MEKNISFTFWILFFKLPQFLTLIQILESSVKIHDYNNLTFEIHAIKLKNNVPQNNKIIFIKSFTC